jgi:hypothetical protein
MQRKFWKILAMMVLLDLAAYGQQPLGDIARQYREKLTAEQAAGTGPKLYTNQDIPPAQQVGTPESSDEAQPTARPQATNWASDDRSTEQRSTRQRFAEHRAAVEWRNRIQAQESRLADLRARIDQLNARVHSGSAQFEGPYNRYPARALQRLEQMQQALDWQRVRLEQMQEAARHAGMQPSVYDP